MESAPTQCSFCLKPQHRVKTLIACQDVRICDKCVLLCVRILLDQGQVDLHELLVASSPEHSAGE
jgi:ATP-dependent protease Clp ATPase subunit